jgi:hypothetical protein
MRQTKKLNEMIIQFQSKVESYCGSEDVPDRAATAYHNHA